MDVSQEAHVCLFQDVVRIMVRILLNDGVEVGFNPKDENTGSLKFRNLHVKE